MKDQSRKTSIFPIEHKTLMRRVHKLKENCHFIHTYVSKLLYVCVCVVGFGFLTHTLSRFFSPAAPSLLSLQILPARKMG